jgi:hypothetical protein
VSKHVTTVHFLNHFHNRELSNLNQNDIEAKKKWPRVLPNHNHNISTENRTANPRVSAIPSTFLLISSSRQGPGHMPQTHRSL